MYPLTLQTEIMRHMLNLAKHMAGGELEDFPQETRRVPVAR